MPPKASKNSSSPLLQDEELVKVIEELKNEFKTRFDQQEARIIELHALLTGIQSENKTLKTALDKKEREICNLRKRANDQEQYMRSWSIRILGLDIPSNLDSSDTYTIMQIVYSKVLLPIFEGAVQKNLLPAIPELHSVLETAHILPTKDNQTPPIIARFYSRNIKAMLFRLKKEFATKATQPDSSERPNNKHAKLAYPFFEDLTVANFKKMQAIAKHAKVLACWSVAGQLRYRLHGEGRVREVADITASVESIIERK